MNRQYAFAGALGVAAMLVFLSAVFDGHFELRYVAMCIGLASALASLVFCVFAALWFKYGTNSELAGAAVVTALGPLGIGMLLSMIGKDVNVHGIAVPVLFFFAMVSELCALILLISVGVRKLRSGWKMSKGR